MRKMIILNLALASFAISSTGLNVDSYTVGGAGGIVNVGSGSTGYQLGMVVGQSGAATAISMIPSAGEFGVVLSGFWIEIPGMAPSATKQTPAVLPAMNSQIQVSFHASEAELNFTVNSETQATARLLTVDGKQLGATWSQSLHAGSSQFQMPLGFVGTNSVVMVVNAGSMQKTYRFVPNLQK